MAALLPWPGGKRAVVGDCGPVETKKRQDGAKGQRMPDLIRASGMGMPPHGRRCAVLAASCVPATSAMLVILTGEAAQKAT
jgi:hypothetical protein